MDTRFHSVRLISEKCKGCVNCIKRCPTEAIRVRSGKAKIIEARCIDCGECIRHCANHAKTAVSDNLDDLKKFAYTIALPAPALYAQFPLEISIPQILNGLKQLGFDDVFEVARGADLATLAIRDYLKRTDIPRPAISSACPAVVRLIQVRFPELIPHIVPLEAPMEVAACLAKREKSRELGFPPEEIGTFFITPCPAKVTAIKQPVGRSKSCLDGAIDMAKIYGELLKRVHTASPAGQSPAATWIGVGWAVAGGEAKGVSNQCELVVHEIHHVINVLEEISMGKLRDIDFIECLACAGGCVGGPLTVENRFVAENRMRKRLEQLRKTGPMKPDDIVVSEQAALACMGEKLALEPRPVLRLDEDICTAIHKIGLMEKTLEQLPGLDCGSCGSPNCKALAEDIAQGQASETDCVFILREKVRDLAEEVADLARKLPPAMGGERKRREVE